MVRPGQGLALQGVGQGPILRTRDDRPVRHGLATALPLQVSEVPLYHIRILVM